jgi:group II intron reverse transcriptase/maturase
MRRKKKNPKMKFHNLYGQLLERPRLRTAFARVKANGGAPGSDGITLEEFEADLEENLTEIIGELRRKEYHPKPIRRVEIPKRTGGKRQLGIPSVRDRVIQENLRDILERIFEPTFSEQNHGFRPGKGCFTALRDLFIQIRNGGVYIVDVDIEKCFDAIPHEPLIDAIAEEVADGSVLNLIRIILNAPVRDGYRLVKPKAGTPQGSPASPLLANIYLAKLDRQLEAAGVKYCRYADDVRATTKSMAEAREIKERIGKGLKAIGLKMSPSKTKLSCIEQGVNFLGYRLMPFKRKLYAVVPRDRVNSFRKRVREITKRNSHLKPQERVTILSEYIRGWGEYYKRSQQPKLFYKLDRWIYRRVIAMYAGRWRSWLFIKYPLRYLRGKGLPSLYRLHKEHINGPWMPKKKRATSPWSA